MTAKIKAIAVIPLTLSIVGFVLSMLCLFAGSKTNYMEDYYIVNLNTSGLGNDLLAKLNPANITSAIDAPFVPEECNQTNPAKKIACEARNKVAEATWNSDAGRAAREKASELINSATAEANELIDKAAKKLGIREFYSLHLMNMCEGYYKPNASTPNAGTNVTECSNQTAMYHFDIISPINEELAKAPDVGLGKLDINKLGIADDLQDGLNGLSTALNVTFVLYAMGIAAAGCCILISLGCFFLEKSSLAFLDLILSTLSFFTLMLSSAIVTTVGKKAAHIINKFGNTAGLHADRGGKYLALTWSSVAVMGVAAIVCLLQWTMTRKQRRNGAGASPKYVDDRGTPTMKQRGMEFIRMKAFHGRR